MANPAVRYGIIVGVIGLIVNIFIAGFIGLCGPVTSLVAGAVAGYLAARAVHALVRGDGARVGATSGAITGAFVLVGQMIGGIAALLIIRSTGSAQINQLFEQQNGSAAQVGFWAGGVAVSACLGLIGIGLAAGAGALAGYFATPAQAASTYAPSNYSQPPQGYNQPYVPPTTTQPSEEWPPREPRSDDQPPMR